MLGFVLGLPSAGSSCDRERMLTLVKREGGGWVELCPEKRRLGSDKQYHKERKVLKWPPNGHPGSFNAERRGI